MMVDGKPGSLGDLKKGMMVLVNATENRHYGTNDPPLRMTNTLLYEDTIEGTVQSVTQDASWCLRHSVSASLVRWWARLDFSKDCSPTDIFLSD